MNVSLPPFVVALEPDPFFAARVEDAVRTAGARPLIVDDVQALWEAIDRWPALVIVNLTVAGWKEPVRRARNLPHTRRIPIVACASLVAPHDLEAAREAGCDRAWDRSRLAAELPELLQRTLHPPPRWVDGWDDPSPPTLRLGIAQFNAGEYWECHETLELLWRAEQRPVRDLYQGILQVGVAYYHLSCRNYPGTVKMLRRGLPRLADLPPVCQGVAVRELHAASRCIHDSIVASGPECIGQFDVGRLPRILLNDGG